MGAVIKPSFLPKETTAQLTKFLAQDDSAGDKSRTSGTRTHFIFSLCRFLKVEMLLILE